MKTRSFLKAISTFCLAFTAFIVMQGCGGDGPAPAERSNALDDIPALKAAARDAAKNLNDRIKNIVDLYALQNGCKLSKEDFLNNGMEIGLTEAEIAEAEANNPADPQDDHNEEGEESSEAVASTETEEGAAGEGATDETTTEETTTAETTSDESGTTEETTAETPGETPTETVADSGTESGSDGDGATNSNNEDLPDCKDLVKLKLLAAIPGTEEPEEPVEEEPVAVVEPTEPEVPDGAVIDDTVYPDPVPVTVDIPPPTSGI